ncbi:putative WD-repeat protein [Suhomyces tanzawaensis NRRL Y-17324]|uniref:Pre-rRNA-processing protein IPI3 n=1 Tax=Suhomyces tanzawaensis NRRL Y-17324 TaxID=984487 RepID=A0A1E4SGY3_9ASCO|nr:putative WD-repeat protein [Suhomyces tanzawaensis NRRL Y-17324]ODV78773.1 putative WD-repeat protein [Suhomyces tanzawaensis NRRL Y-17324]
MDESVFYIAEGAPGDKHSQESFAAAASSHSSQQHASFRQADAPLNGAVLTGTGQGERLIAASKGKALLTVWSWGKEGSDQKIPVPEEMKCLASCGQPDLGQTSSSHTVPSFRVPWLLAAGSKSGKLYVWELASGNLLCVKDAHYQEIATIEFSRCGTYLVTAGHDARCMVWKTLDLISAYTKDEHATKPYYSITDNTLPVMTVQLSLAGLANDLRLYTGSRDGTVRIYDVATRTLVTTFVLNHPVESLAVDPASRAIYAGLNNGLVRTIELYKVQNSVLEPVGGNKKIVTVDHDPELKHTFVHHQQRMAGGADAPVAVTQVKMSFDATNIISGDSLGRVFASNVVTRQVVKAFAPCNSPISRIYVDTCPVESVNASLGSTKNDKKHRLIPQLKRVLVSNDPIEHLLYLEIPNGEDEDEDFEAWLAKKSEEELEFRNLSTINTTVKEVPRAGEVGELQEKLEKVAQAYEELRGKHAELIEEHTKLLSE